MDLACMARAQQAILSEASPRTLPSKAENAETAVGLAFSIFTVHLFGYHFLSSPRHDAKPPIFWVSLPT